MIHLWKLEDAAARWVGTPYNDNGTRCGIAASCHGLCWCLYREAGWEEVPPMIDGPSRWSGRSEVSVLINYLTRFPDRFQSVPVESARPGDMLGFRVGHHVAHAGILLLGGRFVHALRHFGVSIQPLRDPTWTTRLAVAWSPVVPIEP